MSSCFANLPAFFILNVQVSNFGCYAVCLSTVLVASLFQISLLVNQRILIINNVFRYIEFSTWYLFSWISGFLAYTSSYTDLVNNGAYMNSAGVSSTDQFSCSELGNFDSESNYCSPNDIDGCTQYGLSCGSYIPEDYTCSDAILGEINKGVCFSEPSKIGAYCGAANINGGDDVVDNCVYCGCSAGDTCDRVNGKCCDNFIQCGEEFGSDCSYVGQEVCCGDDGGEFVRVGNGFAICCNSGSDTVSADGKCIGRPGPRSKLDFMISLYPGPSESFSPPGYSFLDNILALFKPIE